MGGLEIFLVISDAAVSGQRLRRTVAPGDGALEPRLRRGRIAALIIILPDAAGARHVGGLLLRRGPVHVGVHRPAGVLVDGRRRAGRPSRVAVRRGRLGSEPGVLGPHVALDAPPGVGIEPPHLMLQVLRGPRVVAELVDLLDDPGVLLLQLLGQLLRPPGVAPGNGGRPGGLGLDAFLLLRLRVALAALLLLLRVVIGGAGARGRQAKRQEQQTEGLHVDESSRGPLLCQETGR